MIVEYLDELLKQCDTPIWKWTEIQNLGMGQSQIIDHGFTESEPHSIQGVRVHTKEPFVPVEPNFLRWLIFEVQHGRPSSGDDVE